MLLVYAWLSSHWEIKKGIAYLIRRRLCGHHQRYVLFWMFSEYTLVYINLRYSLMFPNETFGLYFVSNFRPEPWVPCKSEPPDDFDSLILWSSIHRIYRWQIVDNLCYPFSSRKVALDILNKMRTMPDRGLVYGIRQTRWTFTCAIPS